MAEERTYNIPLRKEWLKVPSYARTQKAVRTVRIFIQKHMKNKDVVMGKYLNHELWKRGSQTTPHKVSVTVKTVEDKDRKYVKVELVGAPEEKPKEEKKKSLLKRITGSEEKKEEKTEEKVEEKKEETKETSKKETKKEKKKTSKKTE
jgi:ribosomal protein L31E